MFSFVALSAAANQLNRKQAGEAFGDRSETTCDTRHRSGLGTLIQAIRKRSTTSCKVAG